jgi:23S rRNA pseudouridine2605 synthase
VRSRLQKLLAEAGHGSRRSCEELIAARRVRVNGQVAILGTTVDPEVDAVTLDGQRVSVQDKEYWLLNKPEGVLSAVVDLRGRATVTDYVPTAARVFPVGRLDLNSTGLLLLTNDGELAERLLHPRYHVEKEYEVKVHGEIKEASLQQLRKGVMLDEGMTSPALVVVHARPSANNRSTTTIRVVVHEGKKRQVRRMLESVGHRVVALHRARFASLTDAGLARGQARRLSGHEIATLRKLAGLG